VDAALMIHERRAGRARALNLIPLPSARALLLWAGCVWMRCHRGRQVACVCVSESGVARNSAAVSVIRPGLRARRQQRADQPCDSSCARLCRAPHDWLERARSMPRNDHGWSRVSVSAFACLRASTT
jgi:hypothetical protein